MPRVTRARTAEIQEESDLAASTPLPFTPTRGRAPLGETSNNKVKEPELVNTSEEKMVPAKKIKGKKGNSTKKASKQKKEKNGEPGMEVLEDGNESTTSSAVEEACKDLLKDNPGLSPQCSDLPLCSFTNGLHKKQTISRPLLATNYSKRQHPPPSTPLASNYPPKLVHLTSVRRYTKLMNSLPLILRKTRRIPSL